MSSAREGAMFGLTRLCAIVGGVSGVVLSSVLFPIVTQAKEDWLIAQAPLPAPEPLAAPNPVIVAPAVPPVPLPRRPVTRTPRTPVRPSQVMPVAPPDGTFRIPARPTRRIPIEPFPMPGDYRRPLPDLPAPPDIRTMPQSSATLLSGISGRVSFTPICSVTAPASTCATRPYTGALKISTTSRDRSFRVTPDAQGTFRVRLAPGLYVIEPDAPNFPIGTGQTFNVVSSMVRQMEFDFQGTLPPLRVDSFNQPAP
ncbi:hypothetical protein H6F89_16080 [Cyanobacteria bacterium FACHB-63]|nr:hypothetical protein [Cyanobacteria bacterium FACHB-63]